MSVPALLTDARNYTNALTTQAASAMASAISSAQTVGFLEPSIPALTVTTSLKLPTLVAFPALDTITLDLPNEPAAAPLFQDISPMLVDAAPTLTALPPSITFPDTPQRLDAFLTSAPSIVTAIAFPDAPSALTAPPFAAPVFSDHDTPDAPDVLLPVFSAQAPLDASSGPTDLDSQFRRSFREAAPSMVTMMDGYVDAMLAKYNPRYQEQMNSIEDQLAKYLKGGTGLNAAAENAIYERARGKNDADARRARDLTYSESASRGFTMPTGALLSAIQQARQAGADNNARAAGEIVVMQAEMEQKNLQFAVTTSVGLRTALLNASLSYHQNLISINGQALDYAKTVLSSVIEVYNIAVKAYGLRLDAYKAEASVYEVRLKSAMAGMELYRLEIAALESLTNVDKLKVDIYRARNESLTVLTGVYKSQIDAVLGRASLEKLKLDLFQSQVQAYSSLVQAKSSEWQGYTAAVEGQTAKAKVFSSQVEAFNSQVNSYKVGIEAKVEVIRATALTNQARSTQYSATLAGYTSVVQARGAKASMMIENQRQLITAYQASSQATIANAQLQSDFYKTNANIAIENAKIQLATQIGSAESRRNYGESIAKLGTANATIFANLAGAALSGMNTLSAETLAS